MSIHHMKQGSVPTIRPEPACRASFHKQAQHTVFGWWFFWTNCFIVRVPVTY